MGKGRFDEGDGDDGGGEWVGRWMVFGEGLGGAENTKKVDNIRFVVKAFPSSIFNNNGNPKINETMMVLEQ